MRQAGRILALTGLVLSAGGGTGFAAPEKEDPALYDTGGRRDPFVPLVRDGRIVGVVPGARLELTKPVLYGILWDPGGKSIALINDFEARKGDMIGAYQVVEIRQDSVVLHDAIGEPTILQLPFEQLKEPSSRTTKGGAHP